MRVYDYIQDLRTRLDDSPLGGIPQYFTDANLLTYINNSRKYLARELGLYKRQDFILPELYIDEYDLPNDFRSIINIFDVYNQVLYLPLNQPNTETTKQYYGISTDDNLYYINEIRKKLTFLQEQTGVELAYLISSFSRSGKTITIDGGKYNTGVGTIAVTGGTTVTLTSGLTSQLKVGNAIKDSAGTYSEVKTITNLTVFTVGTTSLATGTGAWTFGNKLSDISKWNTVKGYIEINDTSAGVKEYARVSKVVQTAATAYTLYVSSWDLKQDYKANVQVYGTVTLTNNSTHVLGTATVFNTDLAVNDVIDYNGYNKWAIASITNNTHCVLNAIFNTSVVASTAASITGATIYCDSRPVFVDNDEVKFVPYLMNYTSLSKPLVRQCDNDEMPLDVQTVVPVHAAVEAEMRRSRPNEALRHKQEFEQEKMKIEDVINTKKADLYNAGLESNYRSII